MTARAPRAWTADAGPAATLLAPPLRAAEALFRAGVAVRGALYEAGVLRVARAGVPVVSIGNVAVGGAGKTPAAMAVARRLLARGRAVALLSRGYGAVRRDARVVSDGSRTLLGADEAGDEPLLLARRLPALRVLCGPRRADLARIAVEALGADALLLDDGFQHRALARDLDVVVLDASDPFGNGRLLPAGPNREPRSALRRAGLVWLSRVDQAAPAALEALRALASEATRSPPVESRHAPIDVLDGELARSFGVDALRGRRALLLAGLARPEGFRRTLAGLGAEVASERVFDDHHRFSAAEMDDVLRAAERERCGVVATTEKDAVRLPTELARDPRIRVVRIEAEVVAGEGVLSAALDRVLAGYPTSTSTSTPTSTATSAAAATSTLTPTGAAAGGRRS